MSRCATVAGLVAAAACVATTDTTMEPCGGAGPRRIVSLSAEEHIVRTQRHASLHDELLFEVASEAGSRLVFGDASGDAERTIATDVELLEVGDDVFACDASRGALLRIDPIAGSITELAEHVACAVKATPFGVLALRPASDHFGALLLIDAEAAVTGAGAGDILLDEIRLPLGVAGASAFAVDDAQVFAHRRDGTIVRVDLATREIEVWREGAADFRIDAERMMLVWQRGVPDDPDPLAQGMVAGVDLTASPDGSRAPVPRPRRCAAS